MGGLLGHATARRIIASLLFLGLVGCGSDGTEAGDQSTDRSRFIERANTICEEANEVLRQATAEAFGPDEQVDDRTGIRFTRQVWVPNLREQSRELRELEPPAGDRRRIESMLDDLEAVTDRVEADPALAGHGPFDEVTRRLTDYGIGPCGSP